MEAVPEHFDHPADAAEFRRPAHREGVELYRAHIVSHAFEPHAHDAFGLGAIEAGVERYRYAGGEHVAAAGSLVHMNDDVLHTGQSASAEGWRYRMAYVAPAVVAEVTLENKDIGFVRPGQDAEIKLETFLYTRYGTVPARVRLVSLDAVQDEKRGAIYLATLDMAQASLDVDGQPVALSAGMNLTAEIKTGRRRVIEYLLSPIQRAVGESIRER